MSIYHKWGVVFIQIPKNASAAVHRILENPTDRYHDHRTYVDLMSDNDPELLERYFSFATVRNPYDRFVSAWEFERQNGRDMSFEDTIDEFTRRGAFFYTNEDVFWWPQHRFIAVRKAVLVDEVMKYETLDKDWSRIHKIITANLPEDYSWPSDRLRQENISILREGRPWEEYYTPESKAAVYKLYKKDFELFGYEK